MLGLLFGAALPITCGIYGIYQFQLYVATLPPDMPVCGNPVLGAYAMILVVGPVFGLIGAALGWFTAFLVATVGGRFNFWIALSPIPQSFSVILQGNGDSQDSLRQLRGSW